MHRTVATLMLTAGMAVGVAAPSGATIDVRNHYSFTDSSDFSECGIDDIHLDTVGHGLFTARQVHDSDGQAWFGHDNYDVTDTFTNPANDRSFSITYNGNFREIRARHIEGNIWEFDWRDSGSTWVLRDGDGNVLVRDRGSISATGTYDLLGDGKPGGIVLHETDPVINGVVTEVQWCEEVVEPLLG